ncbi:trigger factor [Pirellula staleyi DSM 6068]|uniref:Trigger factor n=1 Tax=Pirellula staleyi (strain ATCC 27377 / DSM 6068 / ICPB 4128) TaxID=530564 RepID=D2QYY1_PIRSD|nr:trigger factor [Pirellula staleyi]ADB16436.1 trigger factor [Pirellula staleyi DSM 6068]
MSSSEVDTVSPAGEAEVVKLSLDVKVEKPSACERHVKVSVSADDVKRYLKDAFDDLGPKAEVPGFRAGRAPRKLVEARFRDQIADQVKGKLLMDSMTQISEDHDFSAISEPDFNFSAVDLPTDGPMSFEFNIEVRPEFDLPEWKGLKIERLVHEYTEDEVTQHLNKLLARYATQVESTEPIQMGDLVACEMHFQKDGACLAHFNETLEVREVLSLSDTKVENFGELMVGKNIGDEAKTTVTISADAENETLRGVTLDLSIHIVGVQTRKLPDLNEGFLDRIGGFASVDELRAEVKKELDRQLSYQQQRQVRQQITSTLTVAANWDLPPAMLRRQARRELERAVMELQSSGFGNDMIKAYANQLQQNAMAETARALKEHFILERIAEDQSIDAEPQDYDNEIRLLAEQSDESPRKVRARLEKRGLMDTLRNQIIERKVIDVITKSAEFTDKPYTPPKNDITAVDFAVSGHEHAIPDAAHADVPVTPGSPELPKA